MQTRAKRARIRRRKPRRALWLAREALKNAAQHSQASKISIHLAQDGDVITLLVEDDGQGFVLADIDHEEHFGLQMMLERAELANGRLTLRTQPGRGTQILGVFPSERRLRREAGSHASPSPLTDQENT